MSTATTATRVIPIALNGAKGRMGVRIAECATADPSVRVVALLDQGDIPSLMRQPSIPSALASAVAVIDFSTDSGARDAIELAIRLRAALIVGTTALGDATHDAIKSAEQLIPVMTAANTSLGVAVARHLAAEAARLLGSAYDIDIVETHHTKKADAPSGTALALAASVRAAGGTINAERIHALRAGDVIGDHVIQFAGHGEIVRIQHTATNRDVFARGAIRAAQWLVGRPPGRYRIEDTFA